MKRELMSIAFSLALSVYACSSDEEDRTCESNDCQASAGSPSTAGSSSLGSGGTMPTAAAGASAVASQGGTAGVASNHAGANGTFDCGPLCPGGSCEAQPACLAQALGLTEGGAIPVCIPPTVSALSVCASSQCSDGQPGCQLMAQLGSTSSTLSATGNASVTNVSLKAVITAMPGAIDIAMQQTPLCTLTIVVPSAGIALDATGKVSAKSANPSLLGLSFDQVQADYSGVTVDSTVELCRTQGNLLLSTASSSISAALLDNLNARAQALSCLECRADCPEHLACAAQ